jgi:hypothetical protein
VIPGVEEGTGVTVDIGVAVGGAAVGPLEPEVHPETAIMANIDTIRIINDTILFFM